MNKVFYFRVGDKDVRIAMPENGLVQFFTIAMAGILVYDLFAGNLLGALLMALFVAMNTVDIK